MATIRAYSDADWPAVPEICLLAFTPIHESFERSLGTELFALVYPDWKTSNENYLRSLIESGERERVLVAEDSGRVLGFIHYQLNSEKRCGEIGLNAVHPNHQGKGVGSFMYTHVLDVMRSQGANYAMVGTGGDPSHVPARRAYEKVGFVPLPVVNYFRNLSDPDPIRALRTPIGEFRTRPRLVVVCGLPGSGKTCRAKEIKQNLHAVRFCADEWMDAMGINLWEAEARQRIEELQWRIARQILSAGGIVVIEWGTWARSERDVLRTGARRLGAAVELHFLDAPVDVLFDRIRRRNIETPPITFDDVQRWSQVFERPSSEEMALFDAPSEQQHLDTSTNMG